MWYAGRRKTKEIKLFGNWYLILNAELLECFGLGFEVIFCREDINLYITFGIVEFWIRFVKGD